MFAGALAPDPSRARAGLVRTADLSGARSSRLLHAEHDRATLHVHRSAHSR
jgi:hypothetical protein